MTDFLSRLANVSLLALAAMPLVALSLAHAEPLHIQVSDLDLSQPGQRAILDSRIARAADQYCLNSEDRRDLALLNACRSAVRKEALEQLREGSRQEQAHSSKGAHDAG